MEQVRISFFCSDTWNNKLFVSLMHEKEDPRYFLFLGNNFSFTCLIKYLHASDLFAVVRIFLLYVFRILFKCLSVSSCSSCDEMPGCNPLICRIFKKKYIYIYPPAPPIPFRNHLLINFNSLFHEKSPVRIILMHSPCTFAGHWRLEVHRDGAR